MIIALFLFRLRMSATAERAADARLSPGPGEMVLGRCASRSPSPARRAHSVSFQDPCTLSHTPALAPAIPHTGPILTDLALLSNQLPRPGGGALKSCPIQALSSQTSPFGFPRGLPCSEPCMTIKGWEGPQP